MTSVQLSPSPKFLCFLVSSRIWTTNREWSSISIVSLFCSACYNLIQWKGEHLGRWSSKQAGSERRCPHVQLGQTKKHSLFSFLPCLSTLTCFLSTFHSLALPPSSVPGWSLGRASTSLGILAGGALCLRGWGGPRVSFWRKQYEKKKSVKDVFITFI